MVITTEFMFDKFGVENEYYDPNDENTRIDILFIPCLGDNKIPLLVAN